MTDLETLLREGQDRLRGRPATWWEKNRWRVRNAASTVASIALLVALSGGTALALLPAMYLLWYAALNHGLFQNLLTP